MRLLVPAVVLAVAVIGAGFLVTTREPDRRAVTADGPATSQAAPPVVVQAVQNMGRSDARIQRVDSVSYVASTRLVASQTLTGDSTFTYETAPVWAIQVTGMMLVTPWSYPSGYSPPSTPSHETLLYLVDRSTGMVYDTGSTDPALLQRLGAVHQLPKSLVPLRPATSG